MNRKKYYSYLAISACTCFIFCVVFGGLYISSYYTDQKNFLQTLDGIVISKHGENCTVLLGETVCTLTACNLSLGKIIRMYPTCIPYICENCTDANFSMYCIIIFGSILGFTLIVRLILPCISFRSDQRYSTEEPFLVNDV